MSDSERESGCVMLRDGDAERRRARSQQGDRDGETETDTGQTAVVRASRQTIESPHPMKANGGGGHEQMNLVGEQAKNFCM